MQRAKKLLGEEILKSKSLVDKGREAINNLRVQSNELLNQLAVIQMMIVDCANLEECGLIQQALDDELEETRRVQYEVQQKIVASQTQLENHTVRYSLLARLQTEVEKYVAQTASTVQAPSKRVRFVVDDTEADRIIEELEADMLEEAFDEEEIEEPLSENEKQRNRVDLMIKLYREKIKRLFELKTRTINTRDYDVDVKGVLSLTYRSAHGISPHVKSLYQDGKLRFYVSFHGIDLTSARLGLSDPGFAYFANLDDCQSVAVALSALL
jgi:hypothetical protein